MSFKKLALSTFFLVLSMVSAQPVKIGWLSHVYEPWNVVLQDQANQYMENNPDVEIVYSTVPHADLNIRITTSLAAGDAPTVMGVFGPWMPQLLEANALAPAPDWVIADLDANYPAIMKDAATSDGKVYGYVQHIGIFLPIINEALFEKFGVEPPTTYDELVTVSNAMRAADESFLGATMAESKNGSWNVIQWSGILMSNGGQILNDEGTAAAFNSEAGLKAAEVYKQVVHPEIAMGDAFDAELSALIMSGPWQKSSLEISAPDIRYRALPPLAGSAGAVAPSYVWLWVVSATATPEEQEAAWKFISWVSAAEQYEGIYNAIGLIPITNKLPAALADDTWVQAFNEGLKSAKIYYGEHPRWEQIDVAIGEELERFSIGEISAEEFLTIAEARVNDILK